MQWSKPSGIGLFGDGRRYRVMAGGRTVADSIDALLLCSPDRHPVIFFPPGAVEPGVLTPSDRRQRCPERGEARYWHLSLEGRRLHDAAWSYEDPTPAIEALRGYVAFDWKAVEAVWQEEQQLLAHPRNPYVRIDTLRSPRRVLVRGGGAVLAESRRAVFLFETGLPARYYIPRDDVAEDLLLSSPTRSVCPYKGEAHYLSARLETGTLADVAWFYPAPFDEVAAIKDLVCFYPERVDSLEVAAA